MTTIEQVADFLKRFAPLELAENWDNVGLIVGDPQRESKRLMTCLTVTPTSLAEAIKESVDLIVSHHPFPFQPTKRITTEHTTGRMLWDLIRAGISVYSPHTAFDSAAAGINQSLAARIDVHQSQPLVPLAGHPSLGGGRFGERAKMRLEELIDLIKERFQLPEIQFVGSKSSQCQRIAFACGSGGSFLDHAIGAGCDTLITGEANFHTCLAAEANQLSLVLMGHYASERFAVEHLASLLRTTFPAMQVWASREETDPVQFA